MTASQDNPLELAHYLTTEPAVRHCLNVHTTLRESAPEMSAVALTTAFQTFHLADQAAKRLRKLDQQHSLLPPFQSQLGNAASMLQRHLGHHQPTETGEPTYRHWTDYTVHAVRAQHLAALLDADQHHQHHADIENACRYNLNTMHAISTRINPADNWTLHNPRTTPEIKSLLDEARRQYILAASFITVRRRQRMPIVIRPTLAARTSITPALHQHIDNFRRQTDDQSVMPMFHIDPPSVALIYTHDGVIYAQEPQENFAKGYPAEQAKLFAQLLVTLPTQPHHSQNTEPYLYLVTMASFILDKTAAKTPRRLRLRRRRHHQSRRPSRSHRAPTPRNPDRIRSHLKALPNTATRADPAAQVHSRPNTLDCKRRTCCRRRPTGHLLPGHRRRPQPERAWIAVPVFRYHRPFPCYPASPTCRSPNRRSCPNCSNSAQRPQRGFDYPRHRRIPHHWIHASVTNAPITTTHTGHPGLLNEQPCVNL